MSSHQPRHVNGENPGMMVNGNLGTSVAILGAFGLVRFRSVPGTSKEITSVFFAMAIGLATGMGYITFAVMVTIIIGALLLILTKSSFGEAGANMRSVKITIPETLDYTEVFDDLFEKYTKTAILDKVKTTNLGSMFELQYDVELKDNKQEKAFIDELRCRNGNLTIVFGRPQSTKEQL